MATELGAAYLTLMPSLRGASGTIKKELASIGVGKFADQSIGKSIASAATGAFGTFAKVGVGAIATVGAAVGGLAIQGGISRALNIEQAQYKFKAMGMDVESTMASCNAAVKGTAYGLDAAATVAANLGASGVQAGDQMTNSLKAVAGVAAMGGASMEDVGRIFGQVAAKGKLQGDELLQFSERGVNATKALADHLGVTQAEVQEMVSAGEIDFQTFSDAMYATFGDAAQGANATFSGAMSNVRAALSRVGASFASPALQGLRNVFVAAIPAIDAVGEALTPLVDAFANLTNYVSSKLVAGFEAFTATLQATGSPLKALYDGFKATFENTAIGSAVTAIESFASAVNAGVPPMALLQAYASRLWSTLSQASVGTPFEGVVTAINNAAQAAQAASTPIEAIKNVFASLGSSIAPSLSSAGAAVSSFIDGVSARFPIVGAAINGITSAISGLASFITPILSGLVQGVKDFASSFTSAFTSSGTSFQALFSLGSVLTSLISPIGIAKTLFSSFGNDLARLGSVIGSNLTPMLGSLGSILGSTIAALLPGITTAVNALLPVIQQVISTVTNIASALLPLITSAIQQLAPVITNIASIISQVLAMVAPLIAQLASTLLPIIQNIATAIINLAQAVLPVIVAGINMVLGVIQALLPILQTIVSVVVAVATVVATAIGTIVNVVINVVTVVMSVVGQVIAVIANVVAVVTSYFGMIASFISSVIQTVVSVVSSGFNAVLNVVNSVVNSVSSFLSSLFNTVMSIFNQIVSTVTGAMSGVVSTVQSAFSTVVSTVQSAISNVLSVVGSLPGQIQGFFANAGSWLIDAGASIINGLVSGIQGAIGGAISAVSGAVQSIRNLFPFSPAKEGPFSGHGWVLYSGRSIMDAFAKGAMQRKDALDDAFSGIVGSAYDALNMPTAYDAFGGSVPAAATAGITAGRVENNYYLTLDGLSAAGKRQMEQLMMSMFSVMLREGVM